MGSRARRVVVGIAVVQLVVASGLVGVRWVTTSTEPDLVRALADEGHGARDSTVAAETSREPLRLRPASSDALTRVPDEGTYLWETEGSERIGVLPSRMLPERAVRTVTREGRHAWRVENRYSEEHVTETLFESDDAGVVAREHRIELRAGVFGAHREIAFEPGMRAVIFPLEAGQRWQGAWDGETAGVYRGETVERTVLRMGGERVEVWAVQLEVELSGEIEGTVDLKLWVSPEHATTVRESYEMDVRSGAWTYRGNWTSTATSLTPAG